MFTRHSKIQPWGSLPAITFVMSLLSGCSLLPFDQSERLDMWRRYRESAYIALMQDNWKAAEHNYMEALKCARLLGTGNLRQAQTARELAQVYISKGKVSQAEALLKECAEILEQQPLSPPDKAKDKQSLDLTNCLFTLARLYQERGDSQAAISYFDRALAYEQKRPSGRMDVIVMLLQRLESQLAQGKDRKRHALVRQKLSLSAERYSLSLYQESSVDIQKKQYTRANKALSKIVALWPAWTPDEIFMAKVHKDLGYVECLDGEVQSAIKHLKEAVHLLEKNDKRDGADYRDALLRLGVAEDTAYLSEAGSHLLSAVEICRTFNDYDRLATALVGLHRFYVRMAMENQAQIYADKAAAALVASVRREEAGLLLAEQARHCERQKSKERADHYYRLSFEQLLYSPEQPELGIVAKHVSDSCPETDMGCRLNTCQRYLNARQGLDPTRADGEMLYVLGDSLDRLQRSDQAFACFERATTILLKYGNDPLLANCLHRYAASLIGAGRTEEATQRFEQALKVKDELGLPPQEIGRTILPLADLYETQGKSEQSLNLLTRLTRWHKAAPEEARIAYLKLANHAMGIGDLDGAEQLLLAANALGPTGSAREAATQAEILRLLSEIKIRRARGEGSG